jgi:hypothetical protein
MRFLSVFFLATLYCCKAASTTSHEQVTLEKITEAEIGPNAVIEKNHTATFALAYRAKDRSVEYIVIRLSDLKIVIKEKIQGSVTWEGEMQIKVTQTPGMVKLNSKPEDNVKIIDLTNYAIQKK